MSHHETLYLITRDSADERHLRRVYVTGPHFGSTGDIFSSTENRAEATRYTRDDAERYVLRHWLGNHPQVERAD